MQVFGLTAQFGIVSELVDWHRDTRRFSTVFFWSICLPGQLRYCKHNESISLNTLNADDWSTYSVRMMNTHTISTLQEFRLFSSKCIRQSLQFFLNKFLQLLCECIVNLPKGNLQIMKTSHNKVSKIRLVTISEKKQHGSKKRDVPASKLACNYKKSNYPPSFFICPVMKQFALVPASVQNKFATTQSNIQEDFPKHEAQQNSTYQIDSPIKDTNR